MNQKSRALHLPIVLLVDDDEGIRKVVERHLRDIAMVISVPDAARALQVVEQVRVNLVISDYHMPGKDGLKLLEELKEKDPTALRVLLSSDEVPDLAEYEAKGVVSAFLSKPWAPNSLRQLVEGMLKKPEVVPVSERRRAKRVKSTLAISYATRNAKTGKGKTIDLSGEGLRITGDTSLQKGELVSIAVESARGSRVVGIAQVVWTQPQPSGDAFGLRFLGFREPDSKRRLAFWLEDS